MVNCVDCGSRIPIERQKATGGTNMCVLCASNNGRSRKGYMVFSHKTAPEFVMLDADNEEVIRIADRANGRRR